MTSAYAELLLRPDLGKKAYRMCCRLRVPARPAHPYLQAVWLRTLEKAKLSTAEWFIEDMRKEGWEYVDRYGFTMRGPLFAIDPVTLHRPPQLSARQMLPLIMQGARFLDTGRDDTVVVDPLDQVESWDYELAAVFVHPTILTERPDPHEEKEMLRQ